MESQPSNRTTRNNSVNVRHIMSVNDKFEISSGSFQMNTDNSNSEDETDDERKHQTEELKMSVYK